MRIKIWMVEFNKKETTTKINIEHIVEKVWQRLWTAPKQPLDIYFYFMIKSLQIQTHNRFFTWKTISILKMSLDSKHLQIYRHNVSSEYVLPKLQVTLATHILDGKYYKFHTVRISKLVTKTFRRLQVQKKRYILWNLINCDESKIIQGIQKVRTSNHKRLSNLLQAFGRLRQIPMDVK